MFEGKKNAGARDTRLLALSFDPRRRSFRGFEERETETDRRRERERVREGRTSASPRPLPPRDGTERYVNGECGL